MTNFQRIQPEDLHLYARSFHNTANALAALFRPDASLLPEADATPIRFYVSARPGPSPESCVGRRKFLGDQVALHYAPKEPTDGWWVVLRDPAGKGPNISLQRVPERRKRSKLHLDLYPSDQNGEVKRLIGIGATRYPWRYKPGNDFVVLEDPDGYLFCIVQVSEGR